MSWHLPAIRRARLVMASLLVAASCHRVDAARDSFESRAVAALGAPDGYLFVLSPFNCALRAPQIAALNELSARKRRSGRLLSIGHELADSAAARHAVEDLGIRLTTHPLATTRLAAPSGSSGFAVPLAVAIRDGRVIAMLSGPETRRIDSWLTWLEQR